MLWTWARGIYNYITENGGKECVPDYFAIAGLRSVDYITLAALCIFFFLKWTELCLLLWDALLLFTKVMGKLFVVDKWAATGETLWPSGVSVGLGGRLFLHSDPGSATHPSLCELQGNGGVCFPHLSSNTFWMWQYSTVCFALPRRCLRVLFIIKAVWVFFNTVKHVWVYFYYAFWEDHFSIFSAHLICFLQLQGRALRYITLQSTVWEVRRKGQFEACSV